MLQLEIGEGNLNAPSYGYVGPKVGASVGNSSG